MTIEKVENGAAVALKIIGRLDTTTAPALEAAIDGLGEKAAQGIEEAASFGEFLSLDDFRERSKVSKTMIDKMVELGILKGLPQSNQLSIFDT